MNRTRRRRRRAGARVRVMKRTRRYTARHTTLNREPGKLTLMITRSLDQTPQAATAAVSKESQTRKGEKRKVRL